MCRRVQALKEARRCWIPRAGFTGIPEPPQCEYKFSQPLSHLGRPMNSIFSAKLAFYIVQDQSEENNE